MRQGATLNRPIPRSTTWQEVSSRKLTVVNQRVILFAGVLLVAALVGWGASRLILPGTAHAVNTVEYTAVVAQLYQQDHDVSAAQQRLAVFGSPLDLVRQAQQASAAGHLKSAADSPAIDQLAEALAAPASTDASPVATSVPVSQSSNTSGVAAVSDDSSTIGLAGRVSWLGPAVAFVMAFALGIVVLLKTAGLSLPFLKMPRILGGPTSPKSNARRSENRPWEPTEQRRGGISIAEVRLRDESIDDLEDQVAPSSASRPRGVATIERPRASAPRVRRAPVFQSAYRIGDDPFDEIHPISDPSNGSLVAACGLSAAHKLESIGAGGYYAFNAWIQDYVNGESVHAAGLVAPGAPESVRGQIESWASGSQFDTVLPLERGATTQIGSPELGATVTVVDVEFGHDGPSTNSYVSRLTVRFDVDLGDSSSR